jgi:lysozyme family protein
MPFTLTPEVGEEYERLFKTAVIKKECYPEVDKYIDKIVANKASYEEVGTALGIPWYFIGMIHCMEAGLNFKSHLHNGDPLTARTVQVPAGRPVAGQPPFDWKTSATDALVYEKFDKINDWSLGSMLYNLERYNGIGYRNAKININSPYLWSYSSNYTAGKYAADGKYDPKLVSKQCGAAVLLRRLFERQIIPGGEIDLNTQIKNIGEEVKYNMSSVTADNAFQLQKLLNAAGRVVRVDGLSGKNTSDAYFAISGKYLNGDPRRG